MSEEKKAAYRKLEEAIHTVAEVEGFQGVLIEWVVVAASQRYDEDGDGITQVGTLVPDGGGAVPWHRMMGLLDYALTRCRKVVADDGDDA